MGTTEGSGQLAGAGGGEGDSYLSNAKMVFQSSFPVTVGLLLTPWSLAHEALVAAVIALVAGGVLWLTIRFRGRFSARLLLLQGAFFAGYVVYVVTR